MILLYELQKRLANLRPTTTIVTTPTGARYVERRKSSCSEDNSAEQQLEARQYGFVVDTKPDAVPACILSEFLYLGSQDAVSAENAVKYKLTHILSVGIETPNVELPSTVKCKHLPCLDLPETDLLQYVLPVAIDFIEEAHAAKGCVLVHCNAGVSRSASVVIGYLMQRRDMRFEEAYHLVKSWRPCIQPNGGFMQQLKKFPRTSAK
ncbi:dual specificity protein phosphatase 19 [Drosophila sulfurigaster albostrigata]|uniref:dual specificity protein phosphatase 19 n=1 Tax=Drosophila sulfurigaster albostrigata TaxID=89887 RepID=UPI002D21ACE8|nr:dual specificity protein phosphatase 19 [Drosophila sulfurigaster albostrigata]